MEQMEITDFYETDYLFKPVVDAEEQLSPKSTSKNISLFKLPVRYLKRFMVFSLDQNSVENQELIRENINFKILEFDDKKFIVASGNAVDPYPLFSNSIIDFK